MKKRTQCIAFLTIAFLLISAPGFSLLTFDAVLMIPEAVEWYDATSGQFQLETIGGSTSVIINAGELRVAGATTYDYAFDGTITITPSDLLVASTTSDFAAFKDTAGGVIATMTITATSVYEKGGAAIAGVGPILLEAQMVTDSGYWYMSEDTADATSYAGNVDYQMTGGELFDGTEIKMNDFNATYKMQDTSPINGKFTQTMISAHPQITLVAEVPEPATLALLGLGGLLLRRKK